MSHELVTRCKSNKLFSFNTRYLHSVELVEVIEEEVTAAGEVAVPVVVCSEDTSHLDEANPHNAIYQRFC